MKKFVVLLLSLLLFGCIYNIKDTQYSDSEAKPSLKNKLRQFLETRKYTIVHFDYIFEENDMRLQFGGQSGLVLYQNFDSDLVEKELGDKEPGNQVFESDNDFVEFNALFGDDLIISYGLQTQTLNNTDWNNLAWLEEDEHWLYVDKHNWDDLNYPTELHQLELNIYQIAQVFDHINPSSN